MIIFIKLDDIIFIIKKIFISVPKMNERLIVFGMTWGWGNDDRIFICGCLSRV